MKEDVRKEVTIEIHAVAIQQDEQEENRIEAKGELIKKGQVTYLRYQEENSFTTTLMKWSMQGEEVWITRQGEIQVRQHLAPGAETYAIYTTPYGSYSLKTFTHALHIPENIETDEIRLHFNTQLSDGPPLEHRLRISIRHEKDS